MSLIDKRMHYFYQVVAQGGIRAAADVLDIAPSAISRQMASLEQSLGVPLLERHTKGAILTQAGEKVLLHYKQAYHEQERLKQELDDMQGLKAGRVHLSTGVGYLNYVSEMVNEFSHHYPDIVIEIGIHSSTEIIRKIIDSETDIGILYNSINHPNLKSHHKAMHRLCVFMNPSHPLAHKNELELPELIGHKIAFTDHSHGIRQVVARAESKLGIILPTALLCNDMHLLKRYAATGGLAILPEFMLYTNETNLTTRPLILPSEPNSNSHAETQVITRRGRYISIATQAMLGQVIKTLKQIS